MNNELKNFLDDLVTRGPQVDYWFVTKQSMKIDFILCVSQIIERYQLSDKKMSFSKFYRKQFENNPDLKEKYRKQISDNTFRNAIICEYLGLSYRTSRFYEDDYVTDAYKMISRYIKTSDDLEIYHELIEKQIEKVAFNILPDSENYGDIVNFAVVFLYKILIELYNKTGSSYLSYNEFVLFVMRAKSYSEWEKCLNLITYSREVEKFDKSKYINLIVNQKYVKNIRFHELFHELSHIKYIKNKSFEIKDEESIEYIMNVINKFENSEYYEINDKKTVRKFLCSSDYFDGPLNLNLNCNNVDDQLLFDKLDDSVVEEIIIEKETKKNPKNVKNVDNTVSIQIIEFPVDTYKKKPKTNKAPTARLYNFDRINKRKARNGKKAEELVVDYEKLRLIEMGYPNLADKVDRVSKSKGDGLGYDIYSYDVIDGNPVPIYIEVKGTMLDENVPFDITINEKRVAEKYGSNYKIYRISKLGDNIAKCFIINGKELLENMEFDAISFKVYKK